MSDATFCTPDGPNASPLSHHGHSLAGRHLDSSVSCSGAPCSSECPCGEGETGCSQNGDCRGSLRCGDEVCSLQLGVGQGDCSKDGDCASWRCGDDGVCTCPEDCSPAQADWNCCSEECPCQEGEGDCDQDSHCLGDLVCGTGTCDIEGVRGDCCTHHQQKGEIVFLTGFLKVG